MQPIETQQASNGLVRPAVLILYACVPRHYLSPNLGSSHILRLRILLLVQQLDCLPYRLGFLSVPSPTAWLVRGHLPELLNVVPRSADQLQVVEGPVPVVLTHVVRRRPASVDGSKDIFQVRILL